MDGPNIRSVDTQAFRKFALRVRALVGMLDQLDEKGAIELQCGSHVARLMSKLPHDLKANFKRYVHPLRNPIPNLLDFSHWLEFELQVQPTDCKLNTSEMRGHVSQQKEAPQQQLLQHVERLWQIDILPYRNEKVVTHSRCDQEAITLLETKTARVNVNGVFRYATPLLRKRDMPQLKVPKESVLPNLRALERGHSKSPEHAKAYNQEIERLDQSGYVVKLAAEAVDHTPESWYIPHHMVHHNGKHRVVYNCSFQYQGHNLNEYLLAGPTLTSTLLGVLLRFREHAIAITSDIKSMFHQIRLLPEDKPLLRFLWRNLQRDTPVGVFEWQVLPFGTTCSPCCATFSVLKHFQENTVPGEDTRVAVEKHFYVDNFLQSVTSTDKATELVNKLQALLVSGGFELRQWASNIPSVVAHLPVEARSERNELWLTEKQWDVSESILGLHWLCQADTLGYKARLKEPQVPTMRAKVLIQRLWDKKREWDDPLLPSDLLQAWREWEEELQYLNKIAIPRCYTSTELDSKGCKRDIHIFCDASNNPSTWSNDPEELVPDSTDEEKKAPSAA
ncbi:unnamed protein product [Leuciscus chuanchicus]